MHPPKCTLLEYTHRHVEKFVKADDHAGLVEQRDDLNTHLKDAQDELQRRSAEIVELKKQVGRGRTFVG